MSRSDIRVQQQGLETQQVAMQQLVEQIQQLSKSLSLWTPLVANSDYLLHVTPTATFNAGIAKNLAIIVVTVQSTSHLTEPTRLGKRPQGVAHGPGGCLNGSVVGPRSGTDVKNASSQQLSWYTYGAVTCLWKVTRPLLARLSRRISCHVVDRHWCRTFSFVVQGL